MNDLVSLQVSKEVISLYKSFLNILEDLKSKNIINEEQFNIYRKICLDHGNDSERNILTFLSYFDFQINKDKVKEAYNQKIVHKRTVNSGIIEVQ